MKKYLLAAGVVVLLAALYLSHFYAARHAERELDRTLRNWVADANPNAGIQFSGVEIHPFSGTLAIHDLNVFTERHLQRGSLMRFRLGYPMFLRMYLGDASAALDRNLSLQAHLENVSWLDRYRLREVAFDTLELDFSGNPADLLRNALRGSPLDTRQELRARGRGFALSEPYLMLGALQADSLRLQHGTPTGSSSHWSAGSTELELRDLRWRAPDRFVNTYGFFLKGFGYTGRTIPMPSFDARMRYAVDSTELQFEDMNLLTEHVKLNLAGTMNLRDPVVTSPLQGLTMRLSDFSPRFRNVMDGMNRMLELDLPSAGDTLALRLEGTVGTPAVQSSWQD